MVDGGFGQNTTAAAAVQENIAELQFGAEFEEIQILSNAQVAIILQMSANSAVDRDEELNEVYRKTQKYVNRFNSMTNAEKQPQEVVDELDNLQEYVVFVELVHDGFVMERQRPSVRAENFSGRQQILMRVAYDLPLIFFSFLPFKQCVDYFPKGN